MNTAHVAATVGRALIAKARRVWSTGHFTHTAFVVGALLIALLPLAALGPASVAQAAGRRALVASHLQLSPAVINETLNPGDPPTSTSALTLTNSGAGASTWAVASTLPGWLSVSPTSGALATGAATTLTLTFTAPSATPQTLSTTLLISDANADNSPVSVPVNLSIGAYSRTWYFAEGYTGSGFTEYLTLANPNPDTASVTVQYLLQGELPLTATYSVLGNARYTIEVNKVVGPGVGVAMAITSDLPIVAERPMYFTYSGVNASNGGVPGGSDVLGATSLGTTFAFAYLDTTSNHDTYLTILNQNSAAILATVKYYPAAGGTAINRQHTISARSRGTIKVNNEGLGAGMFSAVVSLTSAPTPNNPYTSPALGLVERPMYLVDGVTGYTGAADVIGMPVGLYGGGGSTTWDFAEGITSPTFSERYILANPLSSTASRATVTFYRADGTSAQQQVSLQPGAQAVVDANSVLGSNYVSNSATVTADLPILAERFMSFTYTGGVGAGASASIPGASDVLGAPQASDLYYFAEGYTGGGFAEYLTVENPNAITAHLTVTYLPSSGAQPTIRTYSVGPTSRFTVLTNQVMPTQSFAMLVQADEQVVAERPMYFAYGAQTGGSDIIGYAPHLTPIPNQGDCFCAYVTTSGLNAGGLDQNTGLLEFTYPYDVPLSGAPLVDPINSSTIYFPLWGSQIAALNGGQTQEWRYSLSNAQALGGSMAIDGSDLYFDVVDYSTATTTYAFDAIDTSTGTLAWSTPIDGYSQSQPTLAGGVLYVTTPDMLYAFDPTSGQILWHDSEPSTPYWTAAVAGASNGLVYYRTRTYQSGSSTTDSIEGLNTTTGVTQWSVTVSSGGAALALDANGASLYADDGSGNVYAFDPATGAQQWTAAAGRIAAVGSGMVLTEYPGGASALEALNGSNGAQLWQYTLPSTDYISTQIYIANYIGGAGLSVYFGLESSSTTTNPTLLVSLNAGSGSPNWQFQTAETPDWYPFVGFPYLEVDGSGIYFETAQGEQAVYVYKIDAAKGTLDWKTELDVGPSAFTPSSGMSLWDGISPSYAHFVRQSAQKASSAPRSPQRAAKR